MLHLILQRIDSQEYWVPFSENGLWGIMDGKGNVISPAKWDSIILDNPVYEYFDDLILYVYKGKLGIIHINGKQVLNPEWDAIYFNPGLGYEYNVNKKCRTEYGYSEMSYLSVAGIKEPVQRDFSSLPLYFLFARKNKELFIYDKGFKELVPGPITNAYIETDVFVDFGLIILGKQDKMGILYKWGRNFTGYNFDSVSFWRANDPGMSDNRCFLKIDGQLAGYTLKGKFDYSHVNLVIPDCVIQIRPYADTRSWIYNFTVENGDLLVTDGNSNIYCFSADKELHWIKEIPGAYNYPPVISGDRIIVGNYVYKKSEMSEEPVLLPGNNIQQPAVQQDYILYIADAGPSPDLESTEIPGLQEIDPNMMGSGKKLICYNLTNQAITWNRSLSDHYPSDLPFQVFGNHLLLSLSGPAVDPGSYVLIFDLDDGIEHSRYPFNEYQRLRVCNNTIYLSTYCSTESDMVCDKITVKAFTGPDLEDYEFEIGVRADDHLVIQGDSIFYLDGRDNIAVTASPAGKKIKDLSLKILEDDGVIIDPERITLLTYDGGQLFFLLDESLLLSADISTGDIKKYAFYVDGEWTTFKNKYPVINQKRIYIFDQQNRISVFDLPRQVP